MKQDPVSVHPSKTQVIFFRRAEDEERTVSLARDVLGQDTPSFSVHFASFGQTISAPVTIPAKATGMMLTSRAALSSLPATTLPIHCVGPSTAKACQEAGFTTGIVGKGSLRSLADKLIKNGVTGVLFHPHGEVVNQQHYPLLEQAGLKVMPKCAYRVRKSKKLSIKPLGQQGADRLPLWCVFSVAAALHLDKLLSQSGLQGKRHAVVLTPQVAAALSHWDKVLVSQNPQLESLLTKVKTYLHEQQSQQKTNTG